VAIKVIAGDCREVLRTLPEASVNCAVTSPPYFWLRDYGVDGQIGHEPDVASFVAVLGDVFDEVRRVLRDDGVLWLNLGDSYYSGNGQPMGSDPRSSSRNFSRTKLRPLDVGGWDIPKKSLLGIPWLVAFELQRRGWTLRSDVIWCRPSALSEPSVTDRPGRQHEYLFLLSKSRRYFFNQSGTPEASVWHIAHERGNRAHSAAFPEELVQRCILTGCPEGGTVLDPFGGSGTTGVVADRLRRDAVLIELNPQYAASAQERVAADCGMFASVSHGQRGPRDSCI
jgi:site-specific DNA-methyltransferase (adenine-specific)